MRKSWGFTFAILLAGVIAGCGADSNSGAQSNETAASGNEAQVKKIIVGTGTGFPQICFIDENGKLTGFDVELVREIDERLPGYEFEFQTQEFSNLLLSLETKKVDLVAHQMEKNPEREEKYLFNKEAYAHWRNKIIVSKDNKEPIQSLDDLKGKKVLTSATSAAAQILENYNKDNNNAINIVYQNGAANDTVSQITTGRVDATIGEDFTLSLIDPQSKLKTIGEELSKADILFVFRKDDAEGQQLADAIDGVIKELKSDGTLSELSKEWLGEDFTTE
ncbi:amino acid ABC transporter substrate-binding protein [Paenibacillus sp. FSL H7-0326]|uniref:transporter substrate-binding domain-containing protein n=1 Tax=Paenibacillus sp. FSL H7-0326 TaxID=1921144 RepID=UPI00096C94C1|nr:transporter substrate-binding domain-containing protein [Paenibacillus sp. FSL H7-0326]OMC67144.1 amino acid ABC transporter substrate-binding protein [Paenibacillus sp. FSL H7-0326]